MNALKRREFLGVSMLPMMAPFGKFSGQREETPEEPTPTPVEYRTYTADLRKVMCWDMPMRQLQVIEDTRAFHIILGRPVRLMIAVRYGLLIDWFYDGERIAWHCLPLKGKNLDAVLYDGTPVKEFYWGNGELRYPRVFEPRKRSKWGDNGY